MKTNIIKYKNKFENHTFVKSKKTGFLLLIVTLFFIGCDEQEFLKEVPLDFYSPEVSYVNNEQFEAALVELYATYRSRFWGSGSKNNFPRAAFLATDLIMNDKDNGEQPRDYSAIVNPTSSNVKNLWVDLYGMISKANVIITRADGEDSQLTDEEKKSIKAEALFFRGLSYKMLANAYGGVPLLIEEITSPKRDFVRASRQAVYQQSAEDLEFATQNLLDISLVEDHKISKEVAYHVLSEVYISLERWTDAISSATAVIDNSATALMQNRFGSRVDDPDFGGDVYWDLFRQENQNRSSGNTEALWVLQFEYLATGGGDRQLLLERFSIPRLWRADILDTDGVTRNLLSGGPNTFYYGRGSGFQRPTPYFFNELWEKSGATDIRNSEYNIVRDFKVNNPASPSHGMYAVANNLIKLETYTDSARNFYPIMAKNSTPGGHPLDIYASNQTIPGSLTSSARQTYRDHYVMRLAETYLLRAEAYLGDGNTASAADDINTVRRRSNAPDITSGDVDIDYILDERLRELYYEEFRLLTLTRLGKLADRNRMYNNLYVGSSIQDFHNLWPIPFSEIEVNTEVVLEQNPGY